MKNILTNKEITQLYNYGNTNLPPKSSLVLSTNATTKYNKSILIDDSGNINNLTSNESLEKGTEMSSKVIQQIGARLT